MRLWSDNLNQLLNKWS